MFSNSHLFIKTWLGKDECPATKDLPEDWRERLTEGLRVLAQRIQSSAADSEETSP